MTEGFIKFYRDRGRELLEEDPKAFLLLAQIASRARRTAARYSRVVLNVNQAFIGDPQTIGLSRQEYRNAQKRLTRYGLATFKPTNQGTIATLISVEVYDINAEEITTQEKPTTLSMKKTEKEPMKNQPIKHQKPLTRMKEQEECKKTTTPVDGEPFLYESLQNQPHLSAEDKLSLMAYSKDRVLKALEWAATAKIKTTLIQALNWHCREAAPPPPPDKNFYQQTDQQRAAWKYNQFLKDHGFEELFIKNQETIPKLYAHLLVNGMETTTGLKNSLETVQDDFKSSMNEILKKTNMHPMQGNQND
jgi:hypothetical protein